MGTTSWAAAARLVRRTGFGATGTDVDAVATAGAASYVDRILAADPTRDPGAGRTPLPGFPLVPRTGGTPGSEARKARQKKLRAQGRELTAWWLRRMAAVEQPFGEKLTFVWHAHFATSLKKVKYAGAMATQNQRLRTLGRGDFRTLAYSMLIDTATILWLDGERNTQQGPNENLSREFMEIFTLGHADGYTEDDVREGARALTGWRVDRRTGVARLVPRAHDDGTKTLFGHKGDFGAQQYCDLVLTRPGCAPYVVTSLWHALVSDRAPAADVLQRLLGAYGSRRDLGALLRTMLTDPSFAAAEGTYTVGPVEWALGAARALRVPLEDEKTVVALGATLDSLGQLPFFSPSVGGWPSGNVWLSTAAADLRFDAAARFVRAGQVPTLTGSTTARLETVAHLLGVPAWSSGSLAVLKGAVSDPQRLVAVALNTPEYLVH